MPEYLAPGVFVEEIDSGSKPIEGVGINTAAFVGYAKSGKYHTPTLVTNWTQFTNLFGEEENIILPYLVEKTRRPVATLLEEKYEAGLSWMEYAFSVVEEETIINTLTAWTGKTQSGLAQARREARQTWKQYVSGQLNVLHEGQSEAAAAARAGKRSELQKAVDKSAAALKDYFKKAGLDGSLVPFIDGGYLAHSVRGFFDNGGGRAYIIRIPLNDDTAHAHYDYDPTEGAGAIAAPPAPKRLGAGREGVAAEPKAINVTSINIKKAPTEPDQPQQFTASIKVDGQDKPFNARNASSPEARPFTAADATKVQSNYVTLTLDPTFSLDDLTLDFELETAALVPATNGKLKSQKSAVTMDNTTLDIFSGSSNDRHSMRGLSVYPDVNMICMPDLMAGLYSRVDPPSFAGPNAVGPEVKGTALLAERMDTIVGAQKALVSYCERSGDRMAILDPIPGLKPQGMYDFAMTAGYQSEHGQAAIYYPWIKVSDPLNKGANMLCPPCGHIAGVWARAGSERGVHKAPANEALFGAVDLAEDVNHSEQEILNPIGVNCLRKFPGEGVLVYGARTLATLGNPSWKYINVRRLFNYLEASMLRGMRWVVFEPNDPDLWGRVRRNLSAFLFMEWKEGKLFGETQQDAFYVKCDAETNPKEAIDLGRLYVEIGVNPVKPAEFVIIRIGQWSSGGSLAEQ